MSAKVDHNSRHERNGRPLPLLAGLLLLLGLACNAVTPGSRATLPPPPAARTLTAQPLATATTPGEPPTNTPSPGERTPLPTFTPRQITRDPNVTPRATATLNGTATITATATLTPTATSAGPLTMTYGLAWQVSERDPNVSTATVTLMVRGGVPPYRYYHDDLLQAGPTFSFNYASCTGKPGSFRVDSADGQQARIDYFERSPCP